MAWSKVSRHVRGYGTAWEKLRAQVMRRDKGLCRVCLAGGRAMVAHEVDHKQSKAKGGTDDLANLQAICRKCHKIKTAADEGRNYIDRPAIGLDGWPIAVEA